MATYIKGVTDYIPQIQPWSPDYNFYQNTLERKQAKYDKGWEQVNSVYNSILNAPMMRGQNVEKRDNFFKSVEQQIQQMSDVDLSLAQNVDTASQVFRPFYEDKSIVHDIGFTKNYQDEMQNAEYLRNCTDEKKCGDKYWAGGVKALQYKAQEFVNASDEQALGMSAPKYTNYFNFMKEAGAAVKDAGFKMVEDKVSGGYKVTTTNGAQMIAPLKEFMMSRFGDSPAWNDYNNTKAYLLRKENPEAAIGIYERQQIEAKSNSPEEAQAAIEATTNKKRLEDAKVVINTNAKEEETGLQKMINRKLILQGIVDTTGVVPGSEEDNDYQEALANLPVKEEAAKRAKALADTYNKMEYVDAEGNVVPNHVIDQAVANAMMLDDINRTAPILAFKEASVIKKADPFALASHRNSLGMKRDAFKASLAASKSTAGASIKRIRDLAKTGGREDVARADYIDNLIIENGYTPEQALTKYRSDYNTGLRFYDYPATTTGEGKLTTSNAQPDAKIERQVQRAIDDNDVSVGVKLITDVNDVTSSAYESVEMAKGNVTQRLNQVSNSVISEIITDLTDNPNATKQNVATLGYLGDALKKIPQEAIDKLKAIKIKDGVQLTNAYDKYVANFPTSETEYLRTDPTVNAVKNDKAIKYLVEAIGSDGMYDMLTAEGGNKEGNYFNDITNISYSDALTEIKWGKEAAGKMEQNLNNHMNAVATNMAGDSEGATFVTSVMNDNIIVDKGNKKVVADLPDIYNVIAKNSTAYLNEYRKDNNVTGITPSIIKMEGDLSEHGRPVQFTGDELKGLLATAESQSLNLTDLDYRKLAGDNGVDLIARPGVSSRTGASHTIKPYEDLNRVWPALLNDSKTKVIRSERNPDKIIIKSPYFKSGKSQLLDLNNIDAHEGVQNMFNDVDAEYNKVAANVTDKLQQTGEYTADGLPKAGLYNIVSKTMSDIKIDAVNPNRSYSEVVDLGQEISDNFDRQLPEGRQQGNEALLDMMIKSRTATYSTKAEKDAAPRFNISYNLNTGVRGLTSFTVEFDDYNEGLVAKKLGREVKYNADPDDKTLGPVSRLNIPTKKATYYIQDSNSEIVKKASPDNYVKTFDAMGSEGVFMDDSQMNKGLGKVKYTKKGNAVSIDVLTRTWDPDTEEYTQYTPSYTTTIADYKTVRGGWDAMVKKMNRMLYVAHDAQKKLLKDAGALKTSKSYQ